MFLKTIKYYYIVTFKTWQTAILIIYHGLFYSFFFSFFFLRQEKEIKIK